MEKKPKKSDLQRARERIYRGLLSRSQLMKSDLARHASGTHNLPPRASGRTRG
jgi:hypothetical protein